MGEKANIQSRDAHLVDSDALIAKYSVFVDQS